ncbi:MAG: hypothetical protein Q8P02_03895 [Candidatus Micrarchaeota archaeon]|nr:hypothetical protein [Candidatus Micrarchaeota archaeon]
MPKELSVFEILALVLVFAVVSAAPIGVSPPVGTLALQAALAGIGFALVMVLLFAVQHVFGGKTNAADFFGGVSAAVALTSTVSLLLSVISLQADAYLGSEVTSSVAFSLLPFYPLVAVGWAADAVAQLKTEKGVVLGLLAITLLASLQFGLEFVSGLLV